MEYINDDEREVKIMELNNQRKYLKEESPGRKKENRVQKSPTIFLNEDDDLKDYFHEYLANVGELDGEELDLIEKYLQNEMVKDEEIEEELCRWQHELTDTNEADDTFSKIRQIAEEEIKIMENNYSNHNYMGPLSKKKA